METLGKRLKRRRKTNQRELAAKADVAVSTVCEIERDQIDNPGWKILGRLERALGAAHGSLTRGLDPFA